ncbi:MAG: hypothetical protein QOC63_2418, partial [Mycobacterium sp.]|nr:hypothetical protein [Mycobacterium sp.]
MDCTPPECYLGIVTCAWPVVVG